MSHLGAAAAATGEAGVEGPLGPGPAEGYGTDAGEFA
jgi:hypothetical protein